MKCRVVLAEDHQVVRQGLRALLEVQEDITVVGEAGNGLEAVRLVEELAPDVLILDLMMPTLGGIDVLRRLKSDKHKKTKVVVLTMQSNEAHVHEAFQAGAMSYVLKDAGSQELLLAIRAVTRGEKYLSPPLTFKRVEEYERRTRGGELNLLQMLTRREREVFKLVAEGNSNAEIAGMLHISPRTVEVHRANLMNKLAIRNQVELVRLAVEQGILTWKPGA